MIIWPRKVLDRKDEKDEINQSCSSAITVLTDNTSLFLMNQKKVRDTTYNE